MSKPTLTIQAVTEIAPTTVKANGTIANTGGVNANKRGFVYSLTSHGDPGNVQPGVSGYEFYAQDSGSFTFGIFDIELSSLEKDNKFYIRAFAHNSEGYSYSDEIDFTTLASIYPDAIYSPRTKINKDGVNYDSAQTTKLYSPDVTKLDDEVVSIETKLGLNPQGAYATVRAWLDALASAIGGIVTTFLGLSDTPASYAGSAGKVVAVKGDATGLEFITAAGGEKCTGAEIDTGSDDAKFATSKAIRDSGLLNSVVAGELAAMTAFTALVDADVLLLEASADSNKKYKTLWSNIKSVLKTYFDGLYLALAGGTLTGDITFGENTYLILDNVLSGDGKACGIIQDGVAGAALAFGDLCYLDPTDGRWELADAGVITAADGDCRGTLAICVLAANADGDATKMLFWGKVRAAAFPSFTINAQLFVSETAGDIVEAIPTSLDHAIRCVGVALTAEDLFFNPSPDNITRIA